MANLVATRIFAAPIEQVWKAWSDPVTIGLSPDLPQEVRHLVTFKTIGDNQTEITVTEYDWAVSQMMEMSKQGLEQCLDKMAAIFAKSQYEERNHDKVRE